MSKDGVDHWVVINSHTLANTKSFPAKRDARIRFKQEIMRTQVDYGLKKVDALAKSQGSFGLEKYHHFALTVAGDWNMTLAQAQEALTNLEAQGPGADFINAVGVGSLFVVAIHPLWMRTDVQHMRGADNTHEVVLAKMTFPGPTKQDLSLWETGDDMVKRMMMNDVHCVDRYFGLCMLYVSMCVLYVESVTPCICLMS